MARRGRPSFEPTLGQRQQVEQMVAFGMTHDQMARVVGIDPDTLRLHFEEEIATALARKRAAVAALLFRSAENGNVSAQKHLDVVLARVAAEAAFTGAEPTVKGGKLGKKEEAAEAAITAGEGTAWGDDLQPEGALN